MARARDVTNGAGLLLDWMVSIHERDQVSSADALGTNLERARPAAARRQKDAHRLVVNADTMRANVGRTAA